jgi:TRAP transporter TAXI family solute receptor
MRKLSMHRLTCILVLIVFAGVMTVLFVGPVVSSAQAEQKIIRLGTSKEGTIGYASGVGVTACIKKYVKDVSMEAVPTPGSTASVKIFAKKGVEFAYANTWTLRDAYNDTGPFAKAPITRRPLQGWYWTTADYIILYKSTRKDINSLHDLVGKKFFPFVAGTGIYDIYRYVFTKMGIWDKMKLRQVGVRECPDALKMGTIDALGGYSNLGQLAPPWERELDARLKFKIIMPTAEEKEFIKGISGISCGELSNKWMRPANKALNPEVWGWTVHYGFHPGTGLPTEVMYQIYKVWIEHAKDELAPINAALKLYAENSLKLQVISLEEAKDIPVHPGVAKYLKEKGLWKDHWIVGKLDPGVK